MCFKKTFRGYHGTDKKHYDSLEKDGKEFPFKKLPPDLGNGLYFFIDRVNELGEAIENAEKYLFRWKPNYREKIIVEMELELDSDKVLDLDDRDNQNAFNLFIDGLVLELMIRAYSIDVKAILKETYTQFDMSKQRKRSNIPNGKELCLREYNAIKKKSVCKEL
ncbi:hypothetical protein [Staphylococcus lutrae]|uniref:Uncharacterized protein n=1 Tax=Staphylococcus lutrae TaxID=155085 RepID=A0AAC9WIU9_9STAP|nr:hypothetical protein [Staphylococcus lutrae]ARJ50639.1 hypothetical protein B5P37_04560 [Staphylococcus lutrae]PNZ36906.1 hypothetical protein CD134_07280 [Staphylococcus lutrae]